MHFNIAVVAGARPNFMKIAPLLRSMKQSKSLRHFFIHTGQHYDKSLSDSFLEELDIPDPDCNLGVGSGSHAIQTAKIMIEFEAICLKQRPDLVVVVGDVNSTIACALSAKKLCIPVAHIEAGLRSFDTTMPEEINRLAVDAITDLFFVTEPSGVQNLYSEGKRPGDIYFVGNLMVDSLLYQISKVSSFSPPEGSGSIVLTMHRPSNVDDPVVLEGLLRTIATISEKIPVIFPAHPRTRANIEKLGFFHFFNERFKLLQPLAYNAFLNLWHRAPLVLTDSGGLQEETTALGIPCLTLRNNTERPITIAEGTNQLVGNAPDAILTAFDAFMAGKIKKGKIPELWDGFAADRVVAAIETYLGTTSASEG